MFGFVKKELLQAADAEICKLKQHISMLNDNNRALINELNQIKVSEAYKATKTLEELQVAITNAKAEKILIDSEISKTTNNKVQIIEHEVKKETETIVEQQKATIEAELRELNETKNRAALELIETTNRAALELIESQNTLEGLKEQIAVATNELDEIVDKTLTTEALSTISNDIALVSGTNSQEIKDRITELKERLKYKINNKTAWTAYKHYLLDGSLADGKAQQKRLASFLLSAFNVHVDNIISASKRGNFQVQHKKIEQWFEKINKIGRDHHIAIERDYLIIRLEELKEYCKYHIQLEMEKEEERYINELIREESVAQKEIESFIRNKEKEESEYLKEISKLNKKIESEQISETASLELLISELMEKIKILQQEKQRAMSMAQLTRSGHIYIISNKGSFGPDIYKIGMTRRLDPMDRVRELGDASVPFFFDVHGIIHTEDAPTLERELHKAFDERRVNKDNHRREFFKVRIDEIEEVIRRTHGHITLDPNP